MRRKGIEALVVISAVVLGVAIGTNPVAGKNKKYHPAIDVANFQTAVDNPYFPLVPGTTFHFVEQSDKGPLDNDVTVTHDTKVIMGVTCMIVHDTVKAHGELKEETFDWYAQDKQGTVWYFGEDTKEFHSKGRVSTEGSWEAGVDGAQPGIIMPGQLALKQPYRQEYYKGHAEDMGELAALDDSVKVTGGSFPHCVRTREWSMLEAGDEKKWYAKGVGVVKEVSEKGEVSQLVSMTKAE
jgi:hypothetical protein